MFSSNNLQIEIDASQFEALTLKKQQLLAAFLQSRIAQQAIITEPGVYETIDPNTKQRVTINLKNKLCYRSKKTARTEKVAPRFDIVGKELGGGNFGTVYEIGGTLSLDHDDHGEWQYKPKQNFVLKVFKDAEDYLKEIKFIRKLPHFHGKADPTFLESNPINPMPTLQHAILRRFKGITLDKLIGKEREGVAEQLTVERRLQLTINILQALKEQIHLYGLTHQDIKPDNIMIDPETLQVTFIDLGFCLSDSDEIAYGAGGTCFYAPPEVIRQSPEVTHEDLPALDLFAIGATIGVLWHGDVENDPFSFHRKKKENKVDDIAHDISFNDSENKNILIKRINTLTSFDFHNRGSIDEAVRCFEELKLSETKEKVKADKHVIQVCKHSLAYGLALRDTLGRIACDPKADSQALYTAMEKSIEQVENLCKDMDVRIIGAALATFLDALSIKTFEPLIARNDLTLDVVKASIKNHFSESLNQMTSALDQLADIEYQLTLLEKQEETVVVHRLKEELGQLAERSLYLVDKVKQYPISFDNLTVINDRFKLIQQSTREVLKRLKEDERYHPIWKKMDADCEYKNDKRISGAR